MKRGFRFFYFFLLGAIFLSGCLLFFNKRFFFFQNKAFLAETVPAPESCSSGLENECRGNEAPLLLSENFLPESPKEEEKKTKETEIKDLEGQLVHHLFNIESAPSPKGIAFSPDGKEIWVTSLLNAERGVSVFDTFSGEKIKDINLANGGGVEIIFSPDGKKTYISQMETATVFEIDTSLKEVLRIFNTQSSWTKVLALSVDGKILYASNWSGDDVSEIDIETGKVIRRLATIDTPRGIYITKSGNYLYVAGFGRGEIQKIDLKTGLGGVVYKSGGAMRHIVADEEKEVLYISDMAKNIIWLVSLKDDKVQKFAETDSNPNTIALSPDKKILFVSCRGKNAFGGNYYIVGPEWGSVLLFDSESGEMLDAIVAGNQPTALAVSPDGKILVFSDFLDSRLEVFEIPSYETLKAGNGGRSKVYKNELKK